MSTLWTDEEEQYLKGIINKPLGYVHDHFKDKLGKDEGFDIYRSYESITRKIRRIKASEEFDQEAFIDERWARLIENWEKYREDELPAYSSTNAKDRFILSLSDLHLPFTPMYRIKEVLKRWEKELNSEKSCIVLNGDIMDQYAASHFGKFKKVALIDEYNMTLDLVDLCLDYADNVFMTMGNHEVRLARELKEHISEEVMTVLPTDLLAKIANGEELDQYGLVKGFREKFKGRVHYQNKEPWYIRIGKTIFVHPTAWKSGPLGTVTAMAEYFNTRYSRDDFDSVIMGHTHALAKSVTSNRLLIEQGAMCGRLGYEHQSNLKFKHSQNGYAIIWQDKDGNTNFNDSTPIYLGSMLPQKKKIIF